MTACGIPARKRDDISVRKGGGNVALFRRTRVTTASPAPRAASVKTSAATWVGPSGSPSASADATTPITGTAMVPIAATEAGSRASAANQLT